MSQRIEAGDIGLNDDSRERRLVKTMKEYLEAPPAAGYNIPDVLRMNSIIPRKYLQVRVSRQAAFTHHRAGATAALDSTLRSMCDSGYIMEVDRNKMSDQFNFQGKAYRILQIPDYSKM